MIEERFCVYVCICASFVCAVCMRFNGRQGALFCFSAHLIWLLCSRYFFAPLTWWKINKCTDNIINISSTRLVCVCFFFFHSTLGPNLEWFADFVSIQFIVIVLERVQECVCVCARMTDDVRVSQLRTLKWYFHFATIWIHGHCELLLLFEHHRRFSGCPIRLTICNANNWITLSVHQKCIGKWVLDDCAKKNVYHLKL